MLVDHEDPMDARSADMLITSRLNFGEMLLALAYMLTQLFLSALELSKVTRKTDNNIQENDSE